MNAPIITQMAANLSEVAERNGASFILDKIKAAKTKKDNRETINELEKIICDLLVDKAKNQRIA